MDVNCKKGDKIILTDSRSQTFLGIVKSANPDLGRVVLTDIVQLPEHKSIIGYRNFDRNEIVEIKYYDIEKLDSEKSVQSDEEKQPEKPVIQVTESKERIKTEEKVQIEYSYIRGFDSNFHSAIDSLQSCSKIGIYAKDPSKGRGGRISVIAMSTPTKVFVFDFQAFGDDGVDKGLKQILESPKIVKVVYDCRLLSDCLAHGYLINIENVRDVEAEDIMVVFQERRIIRRHSRPLEYLCKVYLGLEVESFPETSELWDERPLSQNLLELLASHVSILIPLQEEIERKYLQKFIGASNIYKNHLRSLDFFDFLHNDPKKTLKSEISKLLAPQKQTRFNCKPRNFDG